jgi:peptide subunit release factor 1 (eRF1)
MILGCDSKEGARLLNRGGAVRVSLSMGALDIFLLPLNLEVLRGTFRAASSATPLLKDRRVFNRRRIDARWKRERPRFRSSSTGRMAKRNVKPN